MLRNVATTVFVVVQFAVLYCALYLFWASLGNMSFVGLAKVFVAAYAVGASSRKLADMYVASAQKPSDRKGMLDL